MLNRREILKKSALGTGLIGSFSLAGVGKVAARSRKSKRGPHTTDAISMDYFENSDVVDGELSIANDTVKPIRNDVVSGQDIASGRRNISVHRRRHSDHSPPFNLNPKTIADRLNAGVKSGIWKVDTVENIIKVQITERGERILNKSGIRGESTSTDRVSIQHHACGSGVNKLTKEGLYMDDETTEEVVEMLLKGAAISAVATVVLGALGYLGATIFAWIPGALAGFIATLLGVSAAYISVNNEGCGVVIEHNGAVPTGVRPQ